jgi:uridine kinase
MFHTIIAAQYPDLRVIIGQAILGGYFYEVVSLSNQRVDLTILARSVTEKLCELAERDVVFVTRRVSAEEAQSVLSDPFGYKAKLLRCWAGTTVPIAGLDGFTDIQQGPYVVSTGKVRDVRVVAYPPGLILQFQEPPEHQKLTRGQKLFATYRETRTWNERVGVATVGDLNETILDGRIDEVARVAEGLHEKKIVAIADMIAARAMEKPLVCIAGPSS